MRAPSCAATRARRVRVVDGLIFRAVAHQQPAGALHPAARRAVEDGGGDQVAVARLGPRPQQVGARGRIRADPVTCCPTTGARSES